MDKAAIGPADPGQIRLVLSRLAIMTEYSRRYERAVEKTNPIEAEVVAADVAVSRQILNQLTVIHGIGEPEDE